MMKLEVGKYYRTRDGRKVGPLEDAGYGLMGVGGRAQYYTRSNAVCKEDGRTRHWGESPDDIISEWLEGAPDGHQESDYYEWNSALDAVVKQLYHLGNSKLLDGNSAFMVLSIIHEMKR